MIYLKNPLTLFVAFLFIYFPTIYLYISWKNNAKRELVEICGTNNLIELSESGPNSSATIILLPGNNSSVCRLKVRAPKTHIVGVQFIESSTEIRNALIVNKSLSSPPCTLSVFLGENKDSAVWTGDPCSENAMPDVGLMTPEMKFVWTPPKNYSYTRGRKLLVTAIGFGETCKKVGQHTCLKIGWDPLLCISDSLTCDGNLNCPKFSSHSDEDEHLCRSNPHAQSKWEQLSLELFKKLKPPPDLVKNNKWLVEVLEQHNITYDPVALDGVLTATDPTPTYTTTTKKPKSTTENISTAFNQYGPWGYLMLGMLISGTVVLFCGIWECCFGKTKLPQEPSSPSPCASQQTPIQEERPAEPPNYNDLDQPPSYITLFPNNKVTEILNPRYLFATSALQTSNVDRTQDLERPSQTQEHSTQNDSNEQQESASGSHEVPQQHIEENCHFRNTSRNAAQPHESTAICYSCISVDERQNSSSSRCSPVLSRGCLSNHTSCISGHNEVQINLDNCRNNSDSRETSEHLSYLYY